MTIPVFSKYFAPEIETGGIYDVKLPEGSNFGGKCNVLIDRLREVMDWMTWEQPKGALIQHHGVYLVNKDGIPDRLRRIQFAPGPNPVLIFENRWEERPKEQQKYAGERWQPPFSEEDWQWLVYHVVTAGMTPIEHWNGIGFYGASFRLKKYGKYNNRAQQLIETYRKKCPKHGHVFCNDKRHGNCTWYSDGYKKVKFPNNWSG